MALTWNFEQIKLHANENVTNSVINRALQRLYISINELAQTQLDLPNSDANEITYLSDVYNETDNTHTRRWKTLSDIAAELPKPKVVELSDVQKIQPVNGQTIAWQQSNTRWEFKKLPTKINDLYNFSQVVDNPVDQSVLTWSDSMGSFVAQTVPKYIGVGYIYHQICTKPTIVRLPTASAALTGGEQVVITKFYTPTSDNAALPVLVITEDFDENNPEKLSIIGHRGILTHNTRESFASIHLRAVQTSLGNFVWIPVSATGTWKPTNMSTLDTSYTKGQPVYEPAQLTENQVKIQPYNMDVEFNLDGSVASKEFDIKFERADSFSEWSWDQTESSDGLYFSGSTKILSVNHNLFEGTKIVKTNVFFEKNGRLSQITPNEIYFNTNETTKYGVVNIDINEWLNNTTENVVRMKILVSV